MEIKKTTVLSFLVCIAGILAEIMFRDVLAKSAFGVALSVVLAIVIIVLAYFFYDGFISFLTAEREVDKKRQEQYDQKLYAILNEQIQLEKTIYKEVHDLLEKSENTGSAGGDSKEAMEECLEALQAAVEDKKALEKIQNDIQAVIEGEAELKQNQDEMQSRIRKVVEILSVLLSLMRRNKPDDEKS